MGGACTHARTFFANSVKSLARRVSAVALEMGAVPALGLGPVGASAEWPQPMVQTPEEHR